MIFSVTTVSLSVSLLVCQTNVKSELMKIQSPKASSDLITSYSSLFAIKSTSNILVLLY